LKDADKRLCKDKIDALLENLRRRHSVAVAFSGGVDSSLVAALAHRALGQKALAITVDSPLMRANPPDRCYLCKRFRFEKLKEKAIEIDFETVADGTNISDLREYRPGLKAAKELGIYSPLLEAGLSKEDTRMMSDLLGLPTAAKPASPCLATRVPYGQPLELARLERIDRAEGHIRTLTGVKVLRVRDHGNLARIEIGQDEMDLLSDVEMLRQISQSLKRLGYEYVTLDLEGYRSGSFDQTFHDKKD